MLWAFTSTIGCGTQAEVEKTAIPKKIRDDLGMNAGDRITFTLLPDGVVLMRVKNKSVITAAGSLRRRGRKALAIERLSRW